MKVLTIQHDDREKFPLTFPKVLYFRPGKVTTAFEVRVEKKRLTEADYVVKGKGNVTVVERKAKLLELQHNLFGNARKQYNFRKCLDNMRDAHEFPYLFLDMRWGDIWGRTVLGRDPNTSKIYEQPFAIMDRLLQETTQRGIGIIGPIMARTPNARRMAGDWVLRVMLAHIYPEVVPTPQGTVCTESMPLVVVGSRVPVNTTDFLVARPPSRGTLRVGHRKHGITSKG